MEGMIGLEKEKKYLSQGRKKKKRAPYMTSNNLKSPPPLSYYNKRID